MQREVFRPWCEPQAGIVIFFYEDTVDKNGKVHTCCLALVHNKFQETKRLGIFNTFISTCQQKCRNFRDFFIDYVREWNRGRRDYDNLVRLAFSPAIN